MRYQMELTSRYTNIDIGKDDLDFSKYVSKNDQLDFKGKTNGASASAANLSFNCYECKLNLKN